jgi:outer membrane protein assembly factor BamB
MKRMKKIFQIVCIGFFVASLYSFSIPTHLVSNDFSLQKEAIKQNNRQVHFYMKPQKNIFTSSFYEALLRDKIHPRSNLDEIYSLPTQYWIGQTAYPGFPSKEEYNAVDVLEWCYSPSKRYNWTQIAMQEGYNVGNWIREDIRLPISTAPTYWYLCDVVEQNPIVEEIHGNRIVIFFSLNEGIICLDAITGKKRWNVLLSAGEYVIPGMASFRYKEELYIVAATSQKKLLLLASENGKLLNSQLMDAPVITPLHVFMWEAKPYLSFCTENKMLIQDVFSQQIMWENVHHASSNLSPLSLRANNDFIVLFPFQNGTIVGYNLTKLEQWNTQFEGQITHNLTSVAWNGTPYVSIATSKKKLLIFHPLHGKVLFSTDIPGEPKSSIIFLPQYLQYFLVTQRSSQSEEIVFVSGQLGENTAQKVAEIPGKQILGFCAYRSGNVNKFLFLNDQREFFAISSGEVKIADTYPLSLSFIQNPVVESSLGICFALTEGMLWSIVPGEGIVRFGNPSPALDYSSLSMQNYLSSAYLNTSAAYMTGESCYQNMDQMPSGNTIQYVPRDLHVKEETKPIPIPNCFWDPFQNQWFLVLTDTAGNIEFLNLKKERIYNIPLSLGYCYTQPIVQIDQKGNWNIFIVSSKKAVYVKFFPTQQRYETIWDAPDMQSTGSSLISYLYRDQRLFLFITNTGYLVALDQQDGHLRFKKKVDADTFCMQYMNQKPVIFCGSYILHALSGEILSTFGYPHSDSTVISMDGVLLWMQSFEDDMICKSPVNGEIVWKVRKLWCKKYCYRSTSPSVLQKGSIAFSYWSDYTRVVCVDIHTGMIRWRFQLADDFVVEKPIVVDTDTASYVICSTVGGHIIVLDAFRGTLLKSIKMPKAAKPTNTYTGLSAVGFVNGMMVVSHIGNGIYLVGDLQPVSIEYSSKHFSVTTISPANRNKFLFNRAELYWKDQMCFSNTLKIPIS